MSMRARREWVSVVLVNAPYFAGAPIVVFTDPAAVPFAPSRNTHAWVDIFVGLRADGINIRAKRLRCVCRSLTTFALSLFVSAVAAAADKPPGPCRASNARCTCRRDRLYSWLR